MALDRELIGKLKKLKMWSFNREVDSDKITEEKIIWEGPYSWPNFEVFNHLEKLIDTAGVYLWTFCYKDGFLIYAAGVTNSMKRRFATHSREYKKGNYTVLDMEAIQKSQRKEVWHGWQYARKNHVEFIEKKDLILEAVDCQLKSFRIFIAEIFDDRKRKRMEAAIMQNIYNSKENWSEIADRGMYLNGRSNSEIPIRIQNHCQYKIYGLDESFEI